MRLLVWCSLLQEHTLRGTHQIRVWSRVFPWPRLLNVPPMSRVCSGRGGGFEYKISPRFRRELVVW